MRTVARYPLRSLRLPDRIRMIRIRLPRDDREITDCRLTRSVIAGECEAISGTGGGTLVTDDWPHYPLPLADRGW